ncbi:MAG: ATP-binding protein [Blastocatellia bacterium]|nr:ATP-binding protein [Blastocatellia bacterium]
MREFLKEFHITVEEQEKLCDLTVPENLVVPLLQEKKVDWDAIKQIIEFPFERLAQGGSLVFLELTGIGPARKLTIEPAPRLNLITGDNGLGKSFLLDCAWWALTKQWTGQPAMPRPNADKPQIEFEIGAEGRPGGRVRVGYDWEGAQDEKWKPPQNHSVVPGLSIYFRVDGSIAIFDPARRHVGTAKQKNDVPVPFLFSKKDVWDGREKEINGLVRDWVLWQFSPDQESFAILTKVLQRLSPPEAGDLGRLELGYPIRMAGDSRDIPTLNHPYGTVPIVHASAGVQRIITLAYLLVWVWREHRINSQAIRKNPEDQLVLLIDELESHLHPQWQRSLLPALLTVCEELSRELSIQLLIATHSPFVVASVEPDFDPEQDKLFHIDLIKTDLAGKEAEIREVDFVRYGRIGSWLTSEVFNLRQDYGPIEAEKAIEAARRLQQQETPDPQEIKIVTTDLARYLSDLDVFWPRWVKFAEKHGVEI